MTIHVKFQAELVVVIPREAVMSPSTILMEPGNVRRLQEVLQSPDDELARLALTLVNRLPTLSGMQQRITFNKDGFPDRPVVLGNRHKFMLLYHLHTIGHYLKDKDFEWVNEFFATGEAERVLQVAFIEALSLFGEDDRRVVLRVGQDILV
jgi:hypothetical protein